MLGDTFPEKAAAGSLRRMLFDDPGRFGLTSVSIASNCSHLSAGPFEAMFELSNFFGEPGSTNITAERTRMWELMTEAKISPGCKRAALDNPIITIAGNDRSLFDLTEEVDAKSSAYAYRILNSE